MERGFENLSQPVGNRNRIGGLAGAEVMDAIAPDPPRRILAARDAQDDTLQAFLLAAIWGALPLALLYRVAPSSQMIIACLLAGMIAGGAFTLSTVPRAGLVYTWTLAFASAASFVVAGGKVHLFTAIFLLLFTGFIARNVVSLGNLFLENLQAQFKLERQTEIISLLLKEFQENASDWLWQTDAVGRLTYVPDRFAEVAQIPLPLLQGALFSEVLEMLCPDDAITASNIAALMARRAPLHEISVRVVAGGETRLWSFTAKPSHDDDGHFLGHRGFGRDVTERWRATGGGGEPGEIGFPGGDESRNPHPHERRAGACEHAAGDQARSGAAAGGGHDPRVRR